MTRIEVARHGNFEVALRIPFPTGNRTVHLHRDNAMNLARCALSVNCPKDIIIKTMADETFHLSYDKRGPLFLVTLLMRGETIDSLPLAPIAMRELADEILDAGNAAA